MPVFGQAIIYREDDLKDYAQAYVLDDVGDNVCSVPAAEGILLFPLQCVCILPQSAGVPEERDRHKYGTQLSPGQVWGDKEVAQGVLQVYDGHHPGEHLGHKCNTEADM